MVVLGVAMIPLPGPSLPTLVAGLHVLGTEFDCAKTAKNTVVQESKKVLQHSKEFYHTMEEQHESVHEILTSAKQHKSTVVQQFETTKTHFETRHPHLVQSAHTAKVKLQQKMGSAHVEFEKRRLGFIAAH
mmetsp:Transcript_2133/g.2416  ORF Transcript_2133/g.2416 Transcript_2133/m.2416 type:complete len:131 (-) Transcript_2133:69-461(-)